MPPSPLILLALGVGLMLAAWYHISLGHETEHWPQTVGRVLGRRVGVSWFEIPTGPRGFVLYRYHVDGTAYEAERVSYRPYFYKVIGSADRMVYRYEPGTTVTVWYDPRRPERAVLEPGTGSLPWWQLLAGTLCTLGALALLLTGVAV